MPGVKDEDIVLEINKNCKYKRITPNTWILEPKDSTREVNLKIGAKNVKGWIDSSIFKVRRLPNPDAYLGTKSGGIMAKGELFTLNEVYATLGEGAIFEGLKYEVLSFRILSFTNNKIYEDEISGNKLPNNLKVFMQNNLEAGDII